jgi:hypothetical protein
VAKYTEDGHFKFYGIPCYRLAISPSNFLDVKPLPGMPHVEKCKSTDKDGLTRYVTILAENGLVADTVLHNILVEMGDVSVEGKERMPEFWNDEIETSSCKCLKDYLGVYRAEQWRVSENGKKM